MEYDLPRHHRRSIRLKGYDYSQAGAYFITVCARERACLFGDVVNGEMMMNEYGAIVSETWKWIAVQYPYVVLDEWVLMPNHSHGIIVILGADGRGGSRTAPTPPRHKSLGRIVGAFKTVSTKRINKMRGAEGLAVWQRNYFEHIIRDDKSLNRLRNYIAGNPLRWEFDRENPQGVGLNCATAEEKAWRI